MDDINLIYEIYHLPEIKKEGLTDIEYNHRCKYLRLYIRLIKRCQSMTDKELSGPCEVHHIQSKCLGGTNIKTNLVKMPIRYHIMAHIILLESYPDIVDLAYSVFMLINTGKKQGSTFKYRKESLLKNFSSRTISFVREKSLKMMRTDEYRKKRSDMVKGELNPNFGKPRSDDFKRKMTIRMMGSNNPSFGKNYSSSRDYSLSSGKNNKKSKKVISPEGIIYDSASEAAKMNNIEYKHLTYLLTKKNNTSGWKYLDGPSKKEIKKLTDNIGNIFNTLKEASDYYNVSESTVYKWLHGKGYNLYKIRYL